FGSNGGVRNIGAGTGTATTTFGVTINAPVQAAEGVVVAVTAPKAPAKSMPVQDTRNNTYTLSKTVQNGSAPATSLFVFTSSNIKTALNPKIDSVTITTNNNQNMSCLVYAVAG